MYAGELPDWIALNMLPGLGPVTLRRALERWGDVARIAHGVPTRELEALPGYRAGSTRIADARLGLRRAADLEWRRCRKLGLQLLVLGGPDYPALLEMLPDAPILLYVEGELPAGVVRLAVVGSRRPTAYGKQVAVGLGAGLAARGIEVVSGGARGIDTSVHLGALEQGGRTVAVLGSGLARPYPAENRDLFRRIATQGALVSEFTLDHPAKPQNFPRRNRLVSGLSAAVVVVEASRRSGSLITASHAADQGREVLAVPGPVFSERSQGCNRLIQDGARLVQNVDDVIDELSPMYVARLSTPGATGGQLAAAKTASVARPPDEAVALALLEDIGAIHVDELVERAPFGIARLQAALFGLEIDGAVQSLPGGYYQRARPAAGHGRPIDP